MWIAADHRPRRQQRAAPPMGVSATRPNMMVEHQAPAPGPGTAAAHSGHSPSPRNRAGEA
jgi:hypothetical protein